VRARHHEVYDGVPEDSVAEDPWSCCNDGERTIGDRQPTHLAQFFKEKRETIADRAVRVHAAKPPSLQSKPPLIQSDAEEQQALLQRDRLRV